MRTVVEPKREIPIVAEADVIVAGGGPGGLPAAVAAARHGAKVLLIERYGVLGGLATAGLTAPILGHTANKSSIPIVEGMLKEITERMHKLGGAPSWIEACLEWGIRFDAESFKHVADQMVLEANIDLLLHTLVTDAIIAENKINALIIESKSGRQAVAGKIFIDATGDADLAFRAGAPTRKGRNFDGCVQSMGSFLQIGGVQEITEEQKTNAKEKLQEAIAAGKFRFYTGIKHPGLTGNHTMQRDHFTPNMARWPGDPTNVRDLTNAEIGIRDQLWKLIDFLKKQSGFENCCLRMTAFQVGARESRQAIGEYILNGDDIHQGRKFKDAIARGSWWIDIHCPLGYAHPVHLCTVECPRQKDCAFWVAEHDRSMRSKDELSPPPADWYDIPYRCLTPKSIDNLLVSGKCISATHEGIAGARVMGTCIAIGQAAGTAAALALLAQMRPRDIDISKLRHMLIKDGAIV